MKPATRRRSGARGTLVKGTDLVRTQETEAGLVTRHAPGLACDDAEGRPVELHEGVPEIEEAIIFYVVTYRRRNRVRGQRPEIAFDEGRCLGTPGVRALDQEVEPRLADAPAGCPVLVAR